MVSFGVGKKLFIFLKKMNNLMGSIFFFVFNSQTLFQNLKNLTLKVSGFTKSSHLTQIISVFLRQYFRKDNSEYIVA